MGEGENVRLIGMAVFRNAHRSRNLAKDASTSCTGRYSATALI
jgi:hypothetical protein